MTSDLCCTTRNHSNPPNTHACWDEGITSSMSLHTKLYSGAAWSKSQFWTGATFSARVMLHQFASWQLSRKSKLNRFQAELWTKTDGCKWRDDRGKQVEHRQLHFYCTTYPNICHGVIRVTCMPCSHACPSTIFHQRKPALEKQLRLAQPAPAAGCRLQVPLCMCRNNWSRLASFSRF